MTKRPGAKEEGELSLKTAAGFIAVLVLLLLVLLVLLVLLLLLLLLLLMSVFCRRYRFCRGFRCYWCRCRLLLLLLSLLPMLTVLMTMIIRLRQGCWVAERPLTLILIRVRRCWPFNWPRTTARRRKRSRLSRRHDSGQPWPSFRTIVVVGDDYGDTISYRGPN